MKITSPETISGGYYSHDHQAHNTTKPWTKEDNKKFEDALASFDEKTPDRWFKVAAMIPGKSVQDVINQYRVLVADVSDIEAGLVPVPGYNFASSSSSSPSSSFIYELSDDHHQAFDAFRKRCKSYDHERRKGVPWTAEEHRLFLLGLMKHGKGDWRNISRNFVVSKTPTQVASHAQKYYQRQLSSGKDKRRPSIHDMTTFDLTASSSPTYNDKNDPEKSNGVKSPVMMSKMVLGLNNPYNNSTVSPLKVFGSDFLIPYPHDVMTGFANPMINII